MTYTYWREEKKTWRKNLTVFLIVVIAVFSGVIVGSEFTGKHVVVYRDAPAGTPGVTGLNTFVYDDFSAEDISHFSAITIPAVDKDDRGVASTMFVQAVNGSGRILTDIDKLLFWVDTQNSIRRATQIAENYTGMNLSQYDIIYTIQANASVVGGPSAGVAMALATISALQNRSINDSVMITGSLNHDGTIGPVAGIVEKARASKNAGASVFLVPLTQSQQVTYKTREYCEKIGWMDFCTTETYPVKVDIEEDVGIHVIEVMTVEAAADYMLE